MGAEPSRRAAPDIFYFFFVPPFFACARSEPATVFSPLVEDELLSSLEAVDAAFLPVAISSISRAEAPASRAPIATRAPKPFRFRTSRSSLNQ